MAATPTQANLEPDKQTLLDHRKEKHFTAGEVVRDIIIGVSDCLAVPFALAAGLSGANATSSIVLSAGIAEVAVSAISNYPWDLEGIWQPKARQNIMQGIERRARKDDHSS